MSTPSLSLSKNARLGSALALSCALAGCETITFGKVVIETPVAVDPACIGTAVESLDRGEVYGPGSKQPGLIDIGVKRESSAVGVHLYEGIITLSFGWFGRESKEVEETSFRLLEDVRQAVTTSCAIQQPPATITSSCRTRSVRDCGKLLNAT